MRFSVRRIIAVVAAGVLSTSAATAQSVSPTDDSRLIARSEAPVVAAAATAADAARAAEPPIEPTVTRSTADLMRAVDEQAAIIARLSKELDNFLEKAAAAPAPPPPPSAAPPPAVPPMLVDTAGARLRIGGLVQTWYAASDGGVVDTFRIRRSELKLSGDIAPQARWVVMFDPIKTAAPLQDAFITLQPSRAISVDVGQQKIPLGFEGTQSSGRLDTVERALFIADKARGAGWGDVRDLGVVTRARLAGNRMEYAVGVFNGLGESLNDVDRNEAKAVAARALFRPALAGALQVGGSLARGTLRSDPLGGRTRSGVEIAFSHGPWAARSEWMTGRDGLTPRRGYYIQGSTRLAKPVDALFRADVWDPDTRDDASTGAAIERDWLGGLNWRVWAQTVLLQVNYVRKTFTGIQPARSAMLVNLQTNW